MDRTFFSFGAALAFIAVAAGAFGAHGLRDKLTPEMLSVYEIAVRYQMYHALGLFAVALFASRFPGAAIHVAGWMFVAGVAVFSGSLYALALTGLRWLGAITPLGGVAFLVGWGCLVWAALARGAS